MTLMRTPGSKKVNVISKDDTRVILWPLHTTDHLRPHTHKSMFNHVHMSKHNCTRINMHKCVCMCMENKTRLLPVILALGRLEEDCHESEASLGYIVRSKPARNRVRSCLKTSRRKQAKDLQPCLLSSEAPVLETNQPIPSIASSLPHFHCSDEQTTHKGCWELKSWRLTTSSENVDNEQRPRRALLSLCQRGNFLDSPQINVGRPLEGTVGPSLSCFPSAAQLMSAPHS